MLATFRTVMSVAFLVGIAASADAAITAGGYSVVVSKTTRDDPQWRAVVDALVAKHGAQVIVFDTSVDKALPELRRQFPRYACFVAKPTEAGREFVIAVNRLTRRLDNDPYTDVLWGILTGYNAECALRIAQYDKPLVIHRVAAATEVELSLCEEGVWYSELDRTKAVRKKAGEEPHPLKRRADSTKYLVDALERVPRRSVHYRGPCFRARLADRL